MSYCSDCPPDERALAIKYDLNTYVIFNSKHGHHHWQQTSGDKFGTVPEASIKMWHALAKADERQKK